MIINAENLFSVGRYVLQNTMPKNYLEYQNSSTDHVYHLLQRTHLHCSVEHILSESWIYE